MNERNIDVTAPEANQQMIGLEMEESKKSLQASGCESGEKMNRCMVTTEVDENNMLTVILEEGNPVTDSCTLTVQLPKHLTQQETEAFVCQMMEDVFPDFRRIEEGMR